MRILQKIIKLPFRTRDALVGLLKQSKPTTKDPDYKPKDYWKERHSKYGFDLRGVGNCTYSHDENKKIYEKAIKTFSEFCKRDGINLASAHGLEIGCGTGIFTQVLLDSGCKDLLAIDITDTLFGTLKEKFAGVNFKLLDITDTQLDGTYDLIIMIDVTQHIVEDDAFTYAMQNIYSRLADGGVFIVTAWLSEQFTKRTFYEAARPLSYYESAFPKCTFSQPVIFRDKYLFSIRKKV